MTAPLPLTGTSVAIVSGNFSPEIGYQEVDLAKAYARLGARVLVVTSTRPSRNAQAVVREDYPAGLAHINGYEIVRLVPRMTPGSNVLGCKTLHVVSDFAPDHIVLVGPGKLFGLDLFSSDRPPWRRIAIFQDNSEDGRSRSGALWRRGLRAAAHRLVKRRAYRRVVRNADRIVLNVPETREILSSWLGPRERAVLARTGVELRLGFDPETFYFDLEEREAWRSRHSIARDELLLVTCTRATPSKKLESVIGVVSRLRDRGMTVRYVLAGVLNDEYGKTLHEHVAAQPDPSAFLLLPMLGHSEMRQLFSASDLGLWSQTAITIPQAMGTGLPVVLPDRPTVSHLLVDGENGWYINPHETAEQVLRKAIVSLETSGFDERNAGRQSGASANREYLSYDRIALAILGS